MKKFCCVIPVYNNGATIHDVIRRVKRQTPDLLVVDDGSTDVNLAAHYAGTDVEVIRHEHNQGKGAAILSALKHLAGRGFDYMITLDGDGQHFPEDIPLFFRWFGDDRNLVVGCRDFNDPHVPDSSRFGRKFSNFWMRLETGRIVDDCQSGFRAYPLRYISQIHCISKHYNYETEILTRAAWANIPIVNQPVRSYYPPRGERISHFHPWRDNFRISMIHTHLIGLKLLPFHQKKLIPSEKFDFSIFRPKKLLLYLLHENSTPQGLAAAAAIGTILAVLPLVFVHSVAILYVSGKLHLNKLMAFNIQHLFMPPLTPFLCIELGYFLRYGVFLKEFSMRTIVEQAGMRIGEWLLGSLILAPFFACLAGGAVYLAACFYQKRNHQRSKGAL